MPPTPSAQGPCPVRSLFLSSSMAALLSAGALHAQEGGSSFALGTIFIESAGNNLSDGETIVADQITSGTGLPTDILDSPATVSVVTAREFQDRDVQTTEEALNYTAGITTDTYGRDDRFDFYTIRGFEAFTYRDGLLIGDNFGGVREEPYAFDRVEILKGANSTAFGVADPGGAVNYITKYPTGEREREIYGTYGSFERKEIGFDLGDSFGEGSPFSWRLVGKVRDSETESDFSNDDETFFLGGLAWRPSEATTVVLTYDNLFRDGYPNSSGYPANGEEFDRSLFLGDPDFNYLDVDRNTYSLRVEHGFNENLEFSSTLRFTEGTGGYGYVFLGALTGPTTVSRSYFANDAEYENFVGDANLLYRTSFGTVQSRTLAGVEYRDNQRENELFFTGAPDIDFENPEYTGGYSIVGEDPYTSSVNKERVRSLYLQQELDFGSVLAQLGLRYDDIEDSETDRLTGVTTSGAYEDTTARLGLTYRATQDLSIFANYAESIVPAGFGVEPEEGEQYELGVKYRLPTGRGLLTASIFDLSKTNQTVTDPDTLQPRTIGESRSRGVEVEAKAEFTDRFSVIAGYAYLDTEVVVSDGGTNDGNRLGRIPRHSASVWGSYEIPGAGTRGDAELALGLRYTGEYFTDETNATEIEDALIVDAAVGYDLTDTTEMRLNVSNLFDEQHVAQAGFSANYYNPGREIALTLRHSW